MRINKKVKVNNFYLVPLTMLLMSCTINHASESSMVESQQKEKCVMGRTHKKRLIEDSLHKCDTLFLFNGFYMGMHKKDFKERLAKMNEEGKDFYIEGYSFNWLRGLFYKQKLYCLTANREYDHTFIERTKKDKINIGCKDTVLFKDILSYMEKKYGIADSYRIGNISVSRDSCFEADWHFKDLNVFIGEVGEHDVVYYLDDIHTNMMMNFEIRFLVPSIDSIIEHKRDSIFERMNKDQNWTYWDVFNKKLLEMYHSRENIPKVIDVEKPVAPL